MERLELSRLSALTPQASVSTNSTTSASSISSFPTQLPAGAGNGACCTGTASVPVAGVAAGAGELVAGAAGGKDGICAGVVTGAGLLDLYDFRAEVSQDLTGPGSSQYPREFNHFEA